MSRAGTVTEFDADRGLGTIRADGQNYPFHCVELTNGTRTVEPGTSVTFEVLAKFGRYEASQISS